MKSFFCRSFFELFSGTLGEIRAKILLTPKILPAPTPTETSVCRINFDGSLIT